jgi:hypothetical protein
MNLNFLYWVILFLWYFVIALAITNYYETYGVVFLAVCFVVLILGRQLLGKIFKR